MATGLAYDQGMITQIAPAILCAMTDNARREFPRECCGLVFGTREPDFLHVTRAEPAANITQDDPMRNYQIDWKSLFRAVRKSRHTPEPLLGFYHSHPDGSAEPSAMDAEHAWKDHLFIIIPVRNGTAGEPTAWLMPAEGDRFVRLDIRTTTDVDRRRR